MVDGLHRCWSREGDIIRYSVESDSTTGTEWVSRFQMKGIYVSLSVEKFLLSDSFVPTFGVTTEVGVIKAAAFEDCCRTIGDVYAEACRRKLTGPCAEVACLSRGAISRQSLEEMGLCRLVIMHKPINVGCGREPSFLVLERVTGERVFDFVAPETDLFPGDGFAFVYPL